MRDRILKIMEREGLTPSKFAESIGIQRSAMSHIISVQVVAENRKEIGVETPVNIQKQPVVEQVICQEKPSKNVSKIMIFYSDNTFDTFVPEKNKKD